MSYKQIHVSRDNFEFYGHDARNWFDVYSLSDGDETCRHRSTGEMYEITECPKIDSLNVIGYNTFIPYNKSVNEFLQTNIKPLHKCLGVHWRGTDHGPSVIKQEDMLYAIQQQLETGNYQQLFICSDQQDLIDIVINYAESELKFNNVIFNDVTRSNQTPVFYLNVDKVELGKQVLLDSHMLSSCDFVLGKNSNVINYARILKLNLDGFYLDSQKHFLSR